VIRRIYTVGVEVQYSSFGGSTELLLELYFRSFTLELRCRNGR